MRLWPIALFSVILVAACTPGEPAAQALPTAKVVVDTREGPVAFTVEVASDPASQERGLMFRKTLAPNAGMLFDFHKAVPVVFWMKNTPLSLDMLFIKADGGISTIAANAVPYSEDQIPSSEPVRAVLEINGGRAYALDIQPGDKVHAAIFGNGP
ncbi:MAG: DUF192 domain-containing protein [Alphaproteobacteria bacterium]|nr:DUF192 domain-containing protein [Alphaproteobacteria bacterium]MDE2113076.1 DUF192 domain-containing protein [Alphaproteobacteria bacterium]MDE2492875.1 DUF192 domain-containing protein [Alphaproteobacteria bacterium]